MWNNNENNLANQENRIEHKIVMKRYMYVLLILFSSTLLRKNRIT